MPRLKRAGLNVVFDVFGNASKNKLEARGSVLRLHRSLIPLGSAPIASIKVDLVALEAHQLCSYRLICVATHDGVTGAYPNVIERRDAMRRAAPQPRSSVAEITRAGRDHPDQNAERG